MALIMNHLDVDADLHTTCGGSIINNQFVLTAAHCVCINGFEEVPCTEDNEMEYDWKKQIKVYTGVPQNHNIKDVKGRKHFENDIVDISIYPTWKGSIAAQKGVEDAADLAIIKLAKKLEWTKMVKPICLPKVEDLKAPENKAYVAGWGHTEDDKRVKGAGGGGNCQTDNRGPSRNMVCRFPFKFMTNDLENEECITHVFPSDENEKCKQFHEFHKHNFDWGDTDHVKIWYNRKKASTVCYSNLGFKEHGWCGVCLQSENPGEEGYCNPKMTGNQATQNREYEQYHDDIDEEEMEKEATIVKPGKNWGYCSPECSKSAADVEDSAKHLLETMQTIFSNEECNIMAPEVGTETIRKTEVCAGLKFQFPKYKVYDRQFVKKLNSTTNQYKFVHLKDEVDYLNRPEAIQKLGYYIGYSDSCEGDSGGPLYQFVDGKAYQRGIVSRGTDQNTGGCATSDAPGIYTQVYSFLKWIKEKSNTGTC